MYVLFLFINLTLKILGNIIKHIQSQLTVIFCNVIRGPLIIPIKKIGKYIHPTPGFNVIATANTKGKGSDDGRFIGTNVLNEAFLERFPVTFEQDYPAPSVENKILGRVASTLGVTDTDFCKRLVDWGDIIRKTFYDGGIEEIISTRRLVHILRAYSIFNDKAKAIRVCVNRFDDETKQAFLQLYDKVDADFNLPVDEED